MSGGPLGFMRLIRVGILQKCKEEEEEEEEGEGEEVEKKFRYVFALESWVFGLLRFCMEN